MLGGGIIFLGTCTKVSVTKKHNNAIACWQYEHGSHFLAKLILSLRPILVLNVFLFGKKML